MAGSRKGKRSSRRASKRAKRLDGSRSTKRAEKLDPIEVLAKSLAEALRPLSEISAVRDEIASVQKSMNEEFVRLRGLNRQLRLELLAFKDELGGAESEAGSGSASMETAGRSASARSTDATVTAPGRDSEYDSESDSGSYYSDSAGSASSSSDSEFVAPPTRKRKRSAPAPSSRSAPTATVTPMDPEAEREVKQWLASDLFVPKEGVRHSQKLWLMTLKELLEGLAFRGETNDDWIRKHFWPSHRETLNALPAQSKAVPDAKRLPFLADRLGELLPYLPADRRPICEEAYTDVKNAVGGVFPTMRRAGRPRSAAKPKRKAGVSALSPKDYAKVLAKEAPQKDKSKRDSRVNFLNSGIFELNPELSEEKKQEYASWLEEAKDMIPKTYYSQETYREQAGLWLVKNFFRAGDLNFKPVGNAGNGDTIAADLNRQQFISRVARKLQDLGAGSPMLKRVLRRASCLPTRPLHT